jgi:DNA polymerase elongation subunit (family B)
MQKVKSVPAAAVTKNRQREKTNTNYINILNRRWRTRRTSRMRTLRVSRATAMDHLDYIIHIKELDVPYHCRLSIVLQLFYGLWYNNRFLQLKLPVIELCPDIIERYEAVMLAYDIETTNISLKFPDS